MKIQTKMCAVPVEGLISDHQNRINNETNIKEGLSDLIKVTDGSFENIPYESNSFNIVWAQDCIVHSGNRKQVVKEVARVLKPGGYFIFTDLMQAEKVPNEVLKPVLARIHLDSMGSIQFYKDAAKEFGLSTIKVNNLSSHMITHYTRVRAELNSNFNFLTQWCSKKYLVDMEEGLEHWIRAGENSHLCWGILLFQKTE
ncbi:MAG: methyltransferase domain-containing protein [Mariprofundales bacterium]